MRWGLLVLAATCLSCSGGGGGSDPGPATDPGTTVDPGTATDPGTLSDPGTEAAVDTVTGATKLLLTSTHPGWQKPACWTCHTADTHNNGKDPYMCVTCHGTNGAPAGHGKPGPCGGCHATPHAPEGFPDPLSCKGCHPG